MRWDGFDAAGAGVAEAYPDRLRTPQHIVDAAREAIPDGWPSKATGGSSDRPCLFLGCCGGRGADQSDLLLTAIEAGVGRFDL